MSVSLFARHAKVRDLSRDDHDHDDRADQRADEGAHDAAPEAVGQEDREVPDRETHHHPAEQRHQRDLPCRLLRGRAASRAAWEPSLSTRSSGVRSAAGSARSRSGASDVRGVAVAFGGPPPGGDTRPRRLPRVGAGGRCRGPRTSAWNSSRETCWPGSSGVAAGAAASAFGALLAALLGGDGSSTSLGAPLRRSRWRRRARRRVRARCGRGGRGSRARAPSSASAPERR